MALFGGEIGYGEERWTRQPERPSRRIAVERPEEAEIDPITQDAHSFGGDAEPDQPPLQTARYGDQPRRAPRRPTDPPARYGKGRDQVEIVAARRDRDRASEHLAEHHRGHPVGAEIMRVDQVEILPFFDLPSQ